LNCGKKTNAAPSELQPLKSAPDMSSSHVNVLLSIPEAVAREVLTEWVGLKGVARTDSAFCSKKWRSAFFSVAYGFPVVYDQSKGQNCPLEECAPWFLVRDVGVDAISIRSNLSEHTQLRRDFLSTQGSHLLRISIEEDADEDCRRALLDVAMRCSGIQVACVSSKNGHEGGSWDDFVTGFTQACQQLQTLRLNSLNTTTAGMGEALRHCSSLRSLTIKFVIRGVPLEVAIPSLTHLDLTYCGATDEIMHAISANCEQLQSLYVFQGNAITDAGVRAVLQNCPKLQTTDVHLAGDISPGLRAELCRRANYAELRFPLWSNLNDKLAQSVLKVSPSLTLLQASGSWFHDAILAVCSQHCPLLGVLKLDDCHSVTTTGLLQICVPGNLLRELWLDWMPHLQVDEIIRTLARDCPRLEALNGALGFTDDAVVALAHGCRELRGITLQGRGVTDTSVIALATSCPMLESVSLAECPNVTTYGVSTLIEHCRKLLYLYVPRAVNLEGLPRLHLRAGRVFTH
jgi:hypothetical protein